MNNNDERAALQRAALARYLERRQFYPFGVTAKPPAGLGLVVVIPCFDEPDITAVIESLLACEPPGCQVEILVVVNAPAGAPAGALARNAAVVEQLAACRAGDLPDWLQLFALVHNELPADRAGVGLARKLGMDEAAARLTAAANGNGVIASLDADCRVATSYLAALYRAFAGPDAPVGASVYFEHPASLASPDPLQQAMIDYELHLRYYIAGQRRAGFPYAFHTLGSALACTAAAYVAEGGMNLRQGGEDFYFAQKLIAAGPWRTLNTTTVYPGVRLSGRVPFGTGPALQRAIAEGTEYLTFAPEIFTELDVFRARLAVATPDDCAALAGGQPPALQQFLDEQRFADRLAEIAANVATPENFRRRVWRWFNAFRWLKFAQWASRGPYPRIPVSRAAAALIGADARANAAELLPIYRQHDRLTS